MKKIFLTILAVASFVMLFPESNNLLVLVISKVLAGAGLYYSYKQLKKVDVC